MIGPGFFLVGLDLGQKGDATAIAVMEQWVEPLGGVSYVTYEPLTKRRLDVRHLMRVPLGTPYPEVVEMTCDLVRTPGLHKNCLLVVDETGVGAPVIDVFRKAPLDCHMIPVTITGGDQETRGPRSYRVPKRDLVTGLQVLLEQEELRIPKNLCGGQDLVKELMSMQVRVSESGHDSYGALRSGDHDDLVLALALACWGRRFGRY